MKTPNLGVHETGSRPEGDALKELVAATAQAIETREADQRAQWKSGPRPRARKAIDRPKFLQAVNLVVANLAYAALKAGFLGRISYSRTKRLQKSRYDNPLVLTKQFRDVIDILATMGFLETTLGRMNFKLSTFAPSDAFRTELEAYGVTLDDIGYSETDELIVLKWKEDKASSNGEWFRKPHAFRIPYDDTAHTHAMRAEIRCINAYLSQADLVFLEDGQKPLVDTNDRLLRRYFAVVGNIEERFDQGGRLFGGWWMNLKSERRANIRIGGKRCVVVDYASMFPRLAYARQGLSAPEGDLYDLTGHLKGYEADKHRAGVKKVFNSAIFGGKRLTSGTRELLPKGATMPVVLAAILEKHPVLCGELGVKAIGYELMMKESSILIGVLNYLMKLDVVALPLHDGLLVGEGDVNITKEAMESISKDVVEIGMPVTIKRSVVSVYDEYSIATLASHGPTDVGICPMEVVATTA